MTASDLFGLLGAIPGADDPAGLVLPTLLTFILLLAVAELTRPTRRRRDDD